MLKKIIVALLFVCPLAFANWNGSVKKPSIKEIDGKNFYEIATPENLAWFAVNVNKGNLEYNAILKNDIVIWDEPVSSATIKWTPIGTITSNIRKDSSGYRGVFDGAGFKISGIYMDSTYFYSGFFGAISKGGVVKNLTIENAYIQGANKGYAGGFVSLFNGDSILNCEFHGTVVNVYAGGGIAAYAEKFLYEKEKDIGHAAVIRNSRNFGNLSGSQYTGGIAGIMGGSKIIASQNNGNISGSYNGGIAGYAIDSVNVIDSCVNNGLVETTTLDKGISGGILSLSDRAVVVRIFNTINNGDVYSGIYPKTPSGSSVYHKDSCIVGGFIARSEGPVEIRKSVNNGVVTLPADTSYRGYAGGFVGCAKDSVKISESVNYGMVDARRYNGGFIGHTVPPYTYSVTRSTNEGLLGEGLYVGGIIGFGSGRMTIDKCMNRADSKGYLVGGLVGAFRFENVISISSSLKIKNSVNEGNLSGGRYVGGIAGEIQNDVGIDFWRGRSELNNVINKGNLSTRTAEAKIGGIVGYIHGQQSYVGYVKNYGDISFSSGYAGGIVGSAIGDVEFCENYGEIKSLGAYFDLNIGGIAASGAGIYDCANYGNLFVDSIAVERGVDVYVAGVSVSATQVNGSVNKGRIEMNANAYVSSSYLAGIAYDADVAGCLNQGNLIYTGSQKENWIFPIYAGKSNPSGNFSIADTVMINGSMTLGYHPDSCSFIDKSKLKMNTASALVALKTGDMQNLEFAWKLNTCNGKRTNSGAWSQHGTEYPIVADAENHPIYKVSFLDSSKVINVNTYKIDSSYTDYSGRIIKIPPAPDPSDADEDLMFGYWNTVYKIIDEKTEIWDDDSIYAAYIPKDSSISVVSFEIDGEIVLEYVLNSETIKHSLHLPDAERPGRVFLGWYEGEKKVLDADETSVYITAPRKFVAKYSINYYSIDFINQGEVLQSDTLTYGVIPVYRGKIPQKENAKFVKWTPAISSVRGDAAYFATFASVDSTELSSSSVSSSSVVSSSSKLVSNSSSSAVPSSSGKSSSSVSSNSVASSSSKLVSNSSSSAVPSSSEKISSSVAGSSSSAKSSSSSKAKSSSSKAKSSSSKAKSSSSKSKRSSSKAKSSSSKGRDFVLNTVQPTFNLMVNGMTISLSNTQGGIVRIFDGLGHLVAMKSLAGATTSITLQTPGSYIVRVNGMSKSVTLK